jgi:predicted metal-binding protein
MARVDPSFQISQHAIAKCAIHVAGCAANAVPECGKRQFAERFKEMMRDAEKL